MRENNSAGRNIGAFCTKCKVNLDHTIMAMAGEAIGKVRGKNRGGSHRYRNPLVVQKVWKPALQRLKENSGVTA